MIDRIEFHVGKAVEYVKAGTEDTRKALKLQREARKVCPMSRCRIQNLESNAM